MTKQKDKENRIVKIERAYTFWNNFYALHLYPSKGEAFSKAALITVSFVGGVYAANPLVASCFLLFSLSIVMEYCIKLITSKEIIPKILPFILIILNLIVFFFSSADLFKSATSVSHQPLKNIILFVTLGIIWLDSFAMLLFERPDIPNPIESNLKDY